jgi:hypothetical protein
LRPDEDGDFAKLKLGFFDDREVLDRQLSHRVLLCVSSERTKDNSRSFDFAALRSG